ncbi:MAG: hypothetical protein ACX93O_04620 [Flagellimonas sp.]
MRLRLFFLLVLVQQVVSSNEIKFGKVSKEEVAATQHATYPRPRRQFFIKKNGSDMIINPIPVGHKYGKYIIG